MVNSSAAQRRAKQRDQLTKWGDLRGLCPILRDECLLHDADVDSSHVVHFSVDDSTHAHAVVFRDKVFRHVPQVRVNFSSAEAALVDKLLDLVVTCKAGQPVYRDEVPTSTIVAAMIRPGHNLRPGQVLLVAELHTYLSQQAKVRATKTSSAAAPAAPAAPAALAAPASLPGGWTSQQTAWFGGTAWARTWSVIATPSTWSSDQQAFVRSLLTAAVRVATGTPLPAGGTDGADTAASAADDEHHPPPRNSKEKTLAWFRRFQNLQGLCAFLMCCRSNDTDSNTHGPTRAHIMPEDWTFEQAVAFRDRIWPVFPQNREGMSEAQVSFVTSLLDALTGLVPMPLSTVKRSSAAPTASSAAGTSDAPKTEAVTAQQHTTIDAKDVDDAFDDAVAKARAHRQAVAAENAALTHTVAALRAEMQQAAADKRSVERRAQELEAKLADTTTTLTDTIERVKADAATQAYQARLESNAAAALLRDQLASRTNELNEARRAAQCDIDALKEEHRLELARAHHHRQRDHDDGEADHPVRPPPARREVLMDLIQLAQTSLHIPPAAATSQNVSGCPSANAADSQSNPCLRLENGPPPKMLCQALQRFEAGLRETLKIGSIAELIGQCRTSYTFAFHGTPAAEAILCQGFDTSKRSGQQYGPGEYFARDWRTAEGYARKRSSAPGSGSPGVIVTLIISAQARDIANRQWLLVDNPTDDASVSYCLPLMVVRLGGPGLKPCARCAPATAAAGTSGRMPAAVEFQDNRLTWTPMPVTSCATILAAHAAGATRGVLTANGFAYDFDWQRMVQINTQTRRERSIRFV